MDIADKTLDDIASFDIYSCFPVAVASTIDGLGLSADDPRGLTTVGGLPFFGGAGNNYSMHAVCEAVGRSRTKRGSCHMVCAIGGFLSKSDVGIYSTAPADWSTALRSIQLDKPTEIVPLDKKFEGEAEVETYALVHGKQPYAVVVARESGGERRCLAVPAGESVFAKIGEEMPIGRRITVSPGEGKQNLFRF